jgi:hypothetical protein
VVDKIYAFAQPKLPLQRGYVEETLDQAERQFSLYVPQFEAVRRSLGLRSGRVANTGASAGASASASTAPARSTRPAVVRSDTNDEDLPVYAPDDPDPQSTLLLTERLAAEAEAEAEAEAAAATAAQVDAPPAYERRWSEGSIISPVEVTPTMLAPPRAIGRRRSFGALVSRIVSR